jgi:two-component sensor histidine kinase
MLGYKLLYLASLITFTFGALIFSVLTLFYWRERKSHQRPAGGLVFPLFTVACASAFLINLLLRIADALNAESNWVTALLLALALVIGFLFPLLFHVVYADEARHLPGVRAWRWILVGYYAISIGAALVKGLDDSELIATSWSDQLNNAPALMLGLAGMLGLLAQIQSRRQLNVVEGRHRLWTRVLLCLTILCAVANLVQVGTFVSLLPDYLLLAFFCVTLYYKERLTFFDLLIKRGAFFALALVALTTAFAVGPSISARFPADWSRPWISALLFTPFFLMGPWIYGRLAHGIDRVWLRRRYSPEEAERQFVHDIQGSVGEEDLAGRAGNSLREIFQANAEVRFSCEHVPPFEPEGGLFVELEQHGQRLGWAVLAPRTNCIPYMSDDRRLLQAVARTLSVVLENVRFREQQQQREEREQQLRLLASRAELKALRAQINPHFLFNALNAIAGLIQDQPQLADETVEQLAHVFRYTLRRSEKEWVRLDEEVEFVLAYLRVEQARFGDRLELMIDVDPAACDTPVPAMSIQPLIENAIKHGITAREGRGTIGLRATLIGEILRIEVSDNGPGFPAGFTLGAVNGETTRHGLRNILDRLKGYYGDSAQLRWDCTQNGTQVVIEIPQMPASEHAVRNQP